MRAAWILWKKYMMKMNGEEVIGMLIQPILWVLLFSKGMSGMMGTVKSGEYLSFMLPGIMALTILGGAIGGGFTWLSERNAGLVREYWVAPISRIGILAGNSFSNITKSFIQTIVIVIIGILAGAVFQVSLWGIIGSVLLILGFGLGFSGIALALASSTTNEGGYHALIMLLNLPLLFLSNALYSFQYLPGWMKIAARLNPVSYIVDGIRQLLMNQKGDFPLWLCFTVVTGFGLIFMFISVVVFNKSQKN